MLRIGNYGSLYSMLAKVANRAVYTSDIGLHTHSPIFGNHFGGYDALVRQWVIGEGETIAAASPLLPHQIMSAGYVPNTINEFFDLAPGKVKKTIALLYDEDEERVGFFNVPHRTHLDISKRARVLLEIVKNNNPDVASDLITTIFL